MVGWTVPDVGHLREHADSVRRRRAGRRERVNGMSLRALLLAQGAVGLAAALVVLNDVLSALARSHEAGLAHGDITPHSVALTPAGEIRLVGVGGGAGLGTPSLLARFYLAPERWSGPVTFPADATPAGDVYAATVTFFECLAGAPPFYAATAAELRAEHERRAVPLDVLPEQVWELVTRGLAKDSRERPEAWILLAQVGQVAARALGPGWERRGRRELSAFLASRHALPDAPVPVNHSGGAGWRHRKPIRLTAVMGGALALAAGLASPPLAVVLPVGSIFGSGGASPVLAFPEPDRDSVPMRVATNGQLADRAPTHGAPPHGVQTGAARTVAKARPAAPSSPILKSQTAPYARTTPDTSARETPHLVDAVHSQSVSKGSPSEQRTSEQPAPDSIESTSDPSRVSTPANLAAPVAALEWILGGTKTRPDLDPDVLKDIPLQTADRNARDTGSTRQAGSTADTASTSGTGLSDWHSGDTGP